MYYSLALNTKGSVRTLVRSVEESNGAEAWRLIHNRCAPDTQNRQYALMQKITIPAKLWCGGLRAWELDVGEWERASGTALADAVNYTGMMNMEQIFLRNSMHLGTDPNSAAVRAAFVTLPEFLERIRPCELEMERAQMMMTTECKSTLSRKANTKSRKETARPIRVPQTSTRASTVAKLEIGRKTAGDQVEERTTTPPVTTTRRKARITR